MAIRKFPLRLFKYKSSQPRGYRFLKEKVRSKKRNLPRCRFVQDAVKWVGRDSKRVILN